MSKFKTGDCVRHVLSNEKLLIIKPLKRDRYLVQRAWMDKEEWIYDKGIAREIELKKAV